MTKIIIDRSKWRTGSNGPYQTCHGNTLLLSKYGSMCCLGFLSNHLGVPEEDLLNKSAPYEINEKWSNNINVLLKDGNRTGHNPFTTKAININDYEDSTPEYKEERITELFKEHGFEVEFINEFTT